MANDDFVRALQEEQGSFDVNLSEGEIRAFACHFDLLERWNRRINLTRIVEPASVARFHYLECAWSARWLDPGVLAIADVGSGAGFPGLPLAVLRPDVRVWLIEADGRKATFLKESARVCELQNVEVRNERFGPATQLGVDCLASRAIEKFGSFLHPFLLSDVRQTLLFGDSDLLQAASAASYGRTTQTWAIPGSKDRFVGSFVRT